jgi:short-subunit dehydrogenase
LIWKNTYGEKAFEGGIGMKAIITGGSSGLGYEIARQLREKDFDVILLEQVRKS